MNVWLNPILQNKIWIVYQFCKILKQINSKSLKPIVETVLAITVGNDFVERVFSQMKMSWTDKRSKMSISLLKAEICIKNNFNLSCVEFEDYIKRNDKCIKAAKSSQKYK